MIARAQFALGLLAVLPLLMAADAADPLRFVRVHVPLGNLTAVDLGRDRYVPMDMTFS